MNSWNFNWTLILTQRKIHFVTLFRSLIPSINLSLSNPNRNYSAHPSLPRRYSTFLHLRKGIPVRKLNVRRITKINIYYYLISSSSIKYAICTRLWGLMTWCIATTGSMRKKHRKSICAFVLPVFNYTSIYQSVFTANSFVRFENRMVFHFSFFPTHLAPFSKFFNVGSFKRTNWVSNQATGGCRSLLGI